MGPFELTTYTARILGVADIDANGLYDVIVAYSYGGTYNYLRAYENFSDLLFSTDVLRDVADNYVSKIFAITDMNNDGKFEIIYQYWDYRGIYLQSGLPYCVGTNLNIGASPNITPSIIVNTSGILSRYGVFGGISDGDEVLLSSFSNQVEPYGPWINKCVPEYFISGWFFIGGTNVELASGDIDGDYKNEIIFIGSNTDHTQITVKICETAGAKTFMEWNQIYRERGNTSFVSR